MKKCMYLKLRTSNNTFILNADKNNLNFAEYVNLVSFNFYMLAL